MMKVLLTAKLNSEPSLVSSQLEGIEGQKAVKSRFVLIFLDACNRRNAMLKARGEDSYNWAEGTFNVNFNMSHYRKAILQSEAIKFSQVNNTYTAFVRKDTTILDVMKALVSYTGLFPGSAGSL